MSQQRSNDNKTSSTENRSARGYEINGLWYFELRGGGQKGPFESEAAMQAVLNEFIDLHEEMKKSG